MGERDAMTDGPIAVCPRCDFAVHYERHRTIRPKGGGWFVVCECGELVSVKPVERYGSYLGNDSDGCRPRRAA